SPTAGPLPPRSTRSSSTARSARTSPPGSRSPPADRAPRSPERSVSLRDGAADSYGQCNRLAMWEWVVVVPSGYPWSLQVRREVLGAIASGSSAKQAARDSGVALRIAATWWAQACGMELRTRAGGGVARPARAGRPGGVGHRLTLEDRNKIQ